MFSLEKSAMNLRPTFILITICFSFFCVTSEGYEKGSPLNLPLAGFKCTDVPVSEALVMLGQKAGVPVNSIIDELKEPTVAVNEVETSVRDILDKILLRLPGYQAIEKSGTVLLLPKDFEKTETIGLIKTLKSYAVTYSVATGLDGKKLYRCDFLDGQNPTLNVLFTRLLLKQKPKYASFPAVRVFQETTLLDVLTSLSREYNTSWSCSRLSSEFVIQANQDNLKYNYPPSFSDEKAKCYQLYWGKPGYHGESQVSDREASDKKTFWLHQQALKRGIENQSKSPLKLQASIGKEFLEGHTIYLKLTLTNSTDKKITFLNPFRNKNTEAEWQIRRIFQNNGNNGYAEFEVPVPPLPNDPEHIVLKPNETFERSVDIHRSNMTLDELHSDPDLKIEETQTFRPGKYVLRVGLYYKEANGVEYYIFMGGNPLEFQINPLLQKKK